MVKFVNVDIIDCLERIVRKNTVFFQSDFETDRISFKDYAESNNPEDKSLLWMSRFHGTWLCKETEVFMKGSSAYNTWLYYKGEEDILDFSVEITGINENGIIMGNIYPLDYAKHCQRIETNSIHNYITMLVYENGEKIKPDFGYIDEQDEKLGKYKKYRLVPVDKTAFSLLLHNEQNLRSRMSPGDFETYIKTVKQKNK